MKSELHNGSTLSQLDSLVTEVTQRSAYDADAFTQSLLDMFRQSVEAQRAALRVPQFDTCSVCGVSLPMGEEFDNHCCCGTGIGTNPDCPRCNP